MMRTALLFLVLVLVLAAACGPKAANHCASNVTGVCINGEQCTFDEKQGCQVCQCISGSDVDQDDPFAGQGNPDDRSAPPEPVH